MVLEDWISILENNLTLKLDTYNRMELLTLLKELKERRQLDIKSVNEEIDRFRANLAYEKTNRLLEVPDDFDENITADVERKLLYDYGEWELNTESNFEYLEIMDVEVEDE